MAISGIRPGERFSGFAIVHAAEVRMSKSGSNFLDISLGDKTGTVAGKCWDWRSDAAPAVGTVVKVDGVGEEFKGRIQLKISIVSSDADGECDIAELVPSAPEDPHAMFREVLEAVASMRNKALRDIVAELLREANADDRLLYFPAAMQLHHAERGGLLHHITSMLRVAKALVAIHTHLDGDLLVAGVIVHDLGKLDEMEQNPATGLVDGYTVKGKLLGHIVMCVESISRAAERAGAPDESAMLLKHMVLSHHGKMEFGSPVLPRIPEAEVLSRLDELDARIFQMGEALANVAPGGFSNKVWALENRELYRAPDLDASGVHQEQPDQTSEESPGNSLSPISSFDI